MCLDIFQKLVNLEINKQVQTSSIDFMKSSMLLLIALTIFIFSMQSAWADKSDVFNAFVSTNYRHDDNLFRLPDGVKPSNGTSRSDNILSSTVGVSFNKEYSLQRFSLLFTHVDYKYQNADYLDFKANNYSTNWAWALTPYLRGNLSADRNQRASGFGDFRNVNSQNSIVIKNETFDVDFSPYGNWHLLTAYSRRTQTNSAVFVEESSFILHTKRVGVRYLFPSSSFVEFNVKDSNGENTRQVEVDVGQVGRDFDEREDELKFNWMLSGKSTLVSNVSHLKREYDSTSNRNFSGNFGSIQYKYLLSDKTTLALVASRTINAYQLQQTNYSQVDTLAFSPSYAISSKLSLIGNVQFSERNFKGDGPVPTSDERVDKMRVYSLSLAWTPLESLNLGATIKHDERNSNQNFFDYSSNQIAVNGGWTF